MKQPAEHQKRETKRPFLNIGTRSLLFGVHQILIHPWFVALGWWKLYGFPYDPRLWVAFFVHDLGYWGMPNMDGAEGERHPHLGARIMGALFDVRGWRGDYWRDMLAIACNRLLGPCEKHTARGNWYCFTFYHSRYLSEQYETIPSRLCWADKMALVVTPWWLYRLLASATGELDEYMRGQGARDPANGRSARLWFENVRHVVLRAIDQSKRWELSTWETK